MPMTPDQQESDIRTIARTCKGAPCFSAEEQSVMAARWQPIEDSRNWTSALIFKRALEQTFRLGDTQFPADSWEAMHQYISALIFGYQYNCGYNINDLIMSYPLDGEPKEAPCPGCGQMISWVPANY